MIDSASSGAPSRRPCVALVGEPPEAIIAGVVLLTTGAVVLLRTRRA